MASFEAGTSEASSASEEIVAQHLCATPGCGKPAELACPTCLKLGLAPTRFCNQECFKASWKEHNQVHKQVKAARSDEAKLDPSSMPPEFRGYTFTGSLRPWQKTPKRTVPAGIARPDYADHPQVYFTLCFICKVNDIFLVV